MSRHTRDCMGMSARPTTPPPSGVLAGIITFTVIRLRNNPHKEGRRSRFFGSHTRAVWVVLGMIFLVIATFRYAVRLPISLQDLPEHGGYPR